MSDTDVETELYDLVQEYEPEVLDKVIELLQTNPSLNINKRVNRYGDTLLYLAAYENNSLIIQELLKYPGISINLPNNAGKTPLHVAARMDAVESIGVLLRHGADPNMKDNFGDAPLHDAVRYGSYDSLDEFSAFGVNLNITNQRGRTPLHLAASIIYHTHTSNDTSILELLIDKGAEINATDKQGESPLFLACKKRNTKGVQILLSRGAARYINDENNDGWTPLFIACIMGNAEIVTLLLYNGADINYRNVNGETCFNITENPEILSILKNWKTTMLVEMIKTKNAYLDADTVDDFRIYMGKGGRKSNKKKSRKRKLRNKTNKRKK